MSGTREHCACTETAAKKIKLIPFNFSLSLSCVRKNLHGVERRRTAAWNNTPQEHADLVLLCAIARPGGLVASACSSRLLGGIWNLQIFRVLRQLLHPREIQKFIHPAPLSPSLSLQMSLQLNCLTTSTTAVPPFRCLFYIPIPTLCRNNTRFRQSGREYTLFHSCIQLACLLCFDFLFFFSPFFQAPKPVASRFSKVFFLIFFFHIVISSIFRLQIFSRVSSISFQLPQSLDIAVASRLLPVASC